MISFKRVRRVIYKAHLTFDEHLMPDVSVNWRGALTTELKQFLETIVLGISQFILPSFTASKLSTHQALKKLLVDVGFKTYLFL